MWRIPAAAFAMAVLGCAVDDAADERDASTDEPDLSTTEQGLIGGYAARIHALSPVGYWRLGDGPAGWVPMADWSPYAVDGTYSNQATHGGALAQDRDTAVYFSGGYGEVPDRDLYSLTQDYDDFGGTHEGTTWGTATDGGSWTCDVSCGGNYYRKSGAVAWIKPAANGATYQQGRAKTFLSGEMQIGVEWSEHAAGGPLVPVALVAQRVDNLNFVRAELVEDPDTLALTLKLMKTVNGVTQTLNSAVIGVSDLPGAEWWYVRFRFDGNELKARAWPDTAIQPTVWQVEATATGTPSAGRVAIRSSNSSGTVRPTVSFRDFWVQSLGLTVSMFLKVGLNDPERTFPFGKGQNEDAWSTDNNEYYFRFHRANQGTPNMLKAYIFNLDGGLGAGVSKENLFLHTWYHVVVMFDPGDYLDHSAGVHMYVNGRREGGAPTAGATYQATKHCVDACEDFKCTDIDGEEQNCWAISPRNGNRSVHIGKLGTGGYFNGGFDELAIFNRKLTETEIKDLYNRSCQPLGPFHGDRILNTTASASSYESWDPQFHPSNVGDNVSSTRWSSNFSDNEQITIDLGSVRDVSRIRLVWEAAYASTYDVKVSTDGVNFTQVLRRYKTNATEDLVDVNRTARYVRMQGVTRATPWGYSLWEFHVFPCDFVP